MTLLQELINRFDGVEIKVKTPQRAAQPILDELARHQHMPRNPYVDAIIERGVTKIQEDTMSAVIDAHDELERRDIAGAIFDFAAWLTTRDMSLTVGRSHACAGELTDLVAEWARQRGLSIENARVAHWHNGIIPGELARTVDPQAPVTAQQGYVGGSKP